MYFIIRFERSFVFGLCSVEWKIWNHCSIQLFNMEEYLKLASYEYTTSHFCLSGETGSSLRLVQTFLPKYNSYMWPRHVCPGIICQAQKNNQTTGISFISPRQITPGYMYIIFLDRYGDLMNKPVLFCQIYTLYLGKNVGGPLNT